MAIRHKRKSTTGYSWQSSDLVDGQIGVNTADGSLHVLKTDNSVEKIVNAAKFGIQFDLDVGANNEYTLDQDAFFGYTIDNAYYQTASGTITANVKIAGTSVTGLSALSVSSTEGNAASTAAKTVAVGNKLTITFSADSTAVRTSVKLQCTRT